jgi:hypothetical protein
MAGGAIVYEASFKPQLKVLWNHIFHLQNTNLKIKLLRISKQQPHFLKPQAWSPLNTEPNTTSIGLPIELVLGMWLKVSLDPTMWGLNFPKHSSHVVLNGL